MLNALGKLKRLLGAGFILVPCVVLAQVQPPTEHIGATISGAPAAGSVGTVTHLSGTLTVKRIDGSTRFLSTRSGVVEGDTLSTEQGSYARVKFADGAEVVLRPGSQLKVDAYKFDEQKPEQDNFVLSMLKGGMRSVTGLLGKRSRDKVAVNAPNATVGIRGTHFGMLLCQGDCGAIPTVTGGPPANGLHVDVADGAVLLTNRAGQQVLVAGQFGYVKDAASPPVQVPSQLGIQVTMPPSISKNDGGGKTMGKAGKDSECSIQ